MQALPAGGEPINGCAVAAAAAGVSDLAGELFVYSASHSGAVRVHSLPSGEQVRAAGLSEQPLTSVALLPLGGEAGGRRHPLLLCGSYDACIHAYSPDYGARQGSFQAAGDAVACLRVLGGPASSGTAHVPSASSSSRLLAGSWDGQVKVWELAEGRHPWAAGLAQPLAQLAAPCSVWAAAASEDGQLVLAGGAGAGLAAALLAFTSQCRHVLRCALVLCMGIAHTAVRGSAGCTSAMLQCSMRPASYHGLDLSQARQPHRTPALPLLPGTEDGLVLGWDCRQPHSQPAWQLQLVADNYVAGLELCPGSSGNTAVAAAADGTLSLLDLRRLPGSSGSTAVVAAACPSGMPLRCVATDGQLALAGDEGGSLHMWDVAAQLGGASSAALSPGAWTPPQPNGLFPPLASAPLSTVTALAAAPCQLAGQVVLVTAHEAGTLRCFSTAPPE